MDSSHPIIDVFSSLFPFETAVGMNGFVWVNAESDRQIISLAYTIELADGMDVSKIEVLAHTRKQKFLNEM
jgi:exosome complex component RRP40